MKKQTFTLVLLIISNILFSQTILFNEDFESIPTPTVISSSPILITGGDIPSNWEQLNLDGYNRHGSGIQVPLQRIGKGPDEPYIVHDLLT